MRPFVGLLVLVVVSITHGSSRAQQTNDCKACREFREACLKAHSSAACNTDYVICVNHCKKK
jgi:hypothetical protein